MTEQEAIEKIKKRACCAEECNDGCLYREENCAYSKAISALEEVQQYREIGTVEQVKNQKDNLAVAYQIIRDYEQYGTVEDFRKAQGYMRLVKAHGTIGQVIDSCAEYEAIGTVDECREAMEKQRAIEPDYEGDGYDGQGNLVYDTWICPNCGKKYEIDYDEYDYCPKCGQKILWRTGMEQEGEKMRLIDADKLMLSLRCNVLIDVTPELEDEVARQPTAFDKGSVIEDLEALEETESLNMNDDVAMAYTHALAIVEKGGI